MAIFGGYFRGRLVTRFRINLMLVLYCALVWSTLYYLLIRFTKNKTKVTFLVGHVQQGYLQKDVVREWNNNSSPWINSVDKETNSHVNRTTEIKERQLLLELSNLTNLPNEYWSMDAKEREGMSTGTSCARFPSLYDIKLNNHYWQKITTRNGVSFYLYSAYYDNRWRAGPSAQVRILGMVSRFAPPPTFCQLWFTPQKGKDGNQLKSPLMSKVNYTYGWVRQWDNDADALLQPFLLSCHIPLKEAAGRIPVAVSLIEEECDNQTTNLRVKYDRPFLKAKATNLYTSSPNDSSSRSSPSGETYIEKKGEFAVCVKGLNFLYEDVSVRLVEWLELLRILGAEKVFLYELQIHPNISKVLSYYQNEDNLVHLTPITLPGGQPNTPLLRHLFLKARITAKRRNEVIPYNDCLYRNLYRYEYLALLDIDEIIMPKRHRGWRDLMKDVVKAAIGARNDTHASYNFRNVFFLDDMQGGQELENETRKFGIPHYLHMLRHVYRSINYTKAGLYIKCFHNTDRVVWLHNHFPLSCLGSCTTWSVKPDVAHLQHYREDCFEPLKAVCSKDFRAFTTKDTTIWKYKNELVKKANSVLSRLGFFG